MAMVAKRDGVRNRRAARGTVWLIAACAIVVVVALTAFVLTTRPQYAGGVYSNAQYHFSISYPDDWKVNAQPSSSSTLPLSVTITKSGATNTPGDPISTLTIAVFNVHDANIAKSIQSLATDPTLRKTTLSGQSAYASAQVQQQVPGSTISDTHTDYYLVTADWEYQLSTDAVSGQNATSALQDMVNSFKLTD